MLDGVASLRYQFNVEAVLARSHGELATGLLLAEERILAAEQARLEADRARLEADRARLEAEQARSVAEQAYEKMVRSLAEVTADRDALTRAREILWKENKARENEIEVLFKRISELVQQLSETTQEDLQQCFALEIKVLQRRLDDHNQTLYGTSSERRDPPAAEGVEKPAAEKVNHPKKPKRTGSTRTAQPRLPINPVPHTLTAEEQKCGCEACHGDLREMKGQTEDHEEITAKRVVYELNLHQCQKYRCDECGWIKAAPGPVKLISGGRYSPEFAVQSVVSKFVDHMPLERQVMQMERAGLDVTSQALWDQHRYVAQLLLPTLRAHHGLILMAELCFADETHWRMMGKDGTRRWWMWVVSDGRLVYYQVVTSRGTAAGRELLRDFSGMLMADDYSVYNALEREFTRKDGAQQGIDEDGNIVELWTPDFVLLTCWMHVRRYLVKAERYQPTAGEGLDLIGEIYHAEEQAEVEVDAQVAAAQEAGETLTDEDVTLMLLEARRRHREQASRGLVAQLDAWRKKVIRLEGSALAQALGHMDRLWPRLVMFLDDARIPLDNGHSERQIRGPVLGRLNYQGNRSDDGAWVTALFYSLTRSAINLGLNPQDWMNEAVRRALAAPGAIWLPTDHLAMLRERGEAPVLTRVRSTGSRSVVLAGSIRSRAKGAEKSRAGPGPK